MSCRKSKLPVRLCGAVRAELSKFLCPPHSESRLLAAGSCVVGGCLSARSPAGGSHATGMKPTRPSHFVTGHICNGPCNFFSSFCIWGIMSGSCTGCARLTRVLRNMDPGGRTAESMRQCGCYILAQSRDKWLCASWKNKKKVRIEGCDCDKNKYVLWRCRKISFGWLNMSLPFLNATRMSVEISDGVMISSRFKRRLFFPLKNTEIYFYVEHIVLVRIFLEMSRNGCQNT